MSLDTAALRAHFPALAAGDARFDGPGGSLVPTEVASAVSEAMTAGLCQRGAWTPEARRADEIVLGARSAIGDLVASDPAGVAFGRSMTALTFDLARTLAAGWGPGDEVVVTRLDHDANIRPWVIAAERAGATVRWLGFDPETCELDDVRPLLTERTRLVALTAASNLFGTRPDVAEACAAAHGVGALTYVDAVHLAPHGLVDRTGLGADVVVCSPYKFFGPHLGALAADPAFLETLHPDKLAASTEAVPERFEQGTLPYEQLAGVVAAVDFLAGLVPGSGARRARLEASVAALEEHEAALLERLLAGLATLDGARVHGRPARRTPTVLVTFDGIDAAVVQQRLADRGVHAPAGSFYALEASRHAGLGDAGGLRIGLAAYTTTDDVDRLLAELGSTLG